MNKDPYIFPEEDPMIVLYGKYAMCMAKNGNYTKHTRHISRRMRLVRNWENFNIHKLYWCEGGLKLANIATKNVGDHDLTPIMKYIMVRIYNWYRKLVQEEWHNTG